MTIILSSDQLSWIEARIEAGEFSDITGAVRSLLAEAIAEREEDDIDDLAWAKPLVEEALAGIERGHFTVVDGTDVDIDALFRSTEAGWPRSRCDREQRQVSPTSPATLSVTPVTWSPTVTASTSGLWSVVSPLSRNAVRRDPGWGAMSGS